MSNVLITGSAGFVGSHVVDYFLTNTDHNIIGLDRLDFSGNLNRLAELESVRGAGKRFKQVFHDMKAEFNDWISSQLGDIEIVLAIGAASHVDRSIVYPRAFVEDNVIGCVNLLEWARKAKSVKTFLYFSTDEVMGPANPGTYHKEWDPHLPSNVYAASKSAAMQLCHSYYVTYGLPVIQSMTMNLFGPRQASEKYVAKIIRAVSAGQPIDVHCELLNGKPIAIGSRIWLYVENVPHALLLILEKCKPGERINIIGFDELDNLAVAEHIASLMGKPLNPRFVDFHAARKGHDRFYSLSGERLKNMGWSPLFTFDQGIKSTVEFSLSHPQWLQL